MNTLIMRARRICILSKQIRRKTHLILITLFIGASLQSQDCDCSEGGITVGNPGATDELVFLSNTQLPSQTYTGCLKIYGTLVMTSHYTFDNCEIYMGSGAEIVVYPSRKLKIDSSFIEGCETMWKGIHLRNSARLNMNNSIIKDAQYAIYAENYSYLDLKSNVFDANYVGLFVPEKPGYSSNKIHFSNDDIDDNRFTHESDYKPGFIGQFPLPGNSPYAGMYITDVKHITIGKPTNPAVPVKNYFEHLRFGVIFDKCIYTGFYGGQFSDFVYDESSSFLFGGTAIEVRNSDRLDVRYCKVEDARTGVFINNNDRLTIRNNEISSKGIGIYLLGIDKTTTVNANTIISTESDCIVVGLGESQYPLEITNNTLMPYLTGIHLNFFSGYVEIKNNTIQFIHEDNPTQRHGIVGTYLNGSTLIKGNIFTTLDSVDTHVKQAIALNLCSNVLVKENLISGALTDGSTWSGGLYANFSPDNYFCCNEINNTRYGAFFTGACTDSKLGNTTFGGKQTVALFLVNAEISPQENTGNDWSQISEYALGVSADAWYNGDPALLGNSKLTLSPELLPNSYDKIIVPTGELAMDWVAFSGLDSLCEEQLQCRDDAIKQMMVGNFGGVSTQLAEAVYISKKSDIIQQIFDWEKQKNLYKKLYTQPKIRNANPDFDYFFNKHKNGLIGQFYEIEKGIQNSYNAEFEAEINVLIAQNANIETKTIFQETEKIVNDLYLNTIAKGNFYLTEKQKLQVQNLLQSQPETTGTAIWKAQSLVKLLNLKIGFPGYELDLANPNLSDSNVEKNTSETKAEVSIFPNPVTDLLNIKFQSTIKNDTRNDSQNNIGSPQLLRLTNSNGKTVITKGFHENITDFQLVTSNLISGFYLLEIEWKNGLTTQKKVMVIR